MSAIDLNTVARLLALDRGRAVPVASHRQVTIQPDGLVLCCLAMAGEDTTIHIAAVGRVGRPPEFRSVPDPRTRDDQFGLYEWLADRVEGYFDSCRRSGSYPQIWVSSDAAVTHLDVLADRLRYNNLNARVKRFGELLSYATERWPIDGQQALQSATRALRLHYATGQQEAEDEHLGALLTWIEPPKGRNVLASVAIEEQIPMGVKTDPQFDIGVLEKLVNAYFGAKRRSAGPGELSARAKAVHNGLQPVVARIYEGTQRAIAIVREEFSQPWPALSDLQTLETEAFESFMISRDNGFPLALRDKPKAALFKIAERENARETTEAALRAGDRVALAGARLSGRVLTGTVENPQTIRLGPRRFELSFDLVSVQRVLRVRPRDEFHLLSDSRQVVRVTTVQRTGRLTRVGLVIVKGSRAVGLPATRATAEFIPSVPEWDGLGRLRTQFKTRLAIEPWTHSDRGIPAAVRASVQRPADLLAAVEGLR